MEVNMIAHNFFMLPSNLITKVGVATFEISGISRVVLAQLTRHRTFSFSVQSMRYVKQSEFVDPCDIAYPIQESFEAYGNLMLQDGLKKQEARYVLPLATSTRLIMSMPLKYAVGYFKQRLHVSAQPEHRALAVLLYDCFDVDIRQRFIEEYMPINMMFLKASIDNDVRQFLTQGG